MPECSFNFSDRTFIVTGATRGIGKGIASAFLNSGATVVGTYASNDQAAEDFMTQAKDMPGKLLLKKFDVSSFEACELFFENILKEVDKIDGLINNSGKRIDNIVASTFFLFPAGRVMNPKSSHTNFWTGHCATLPTTKICSAPHHNFRTTMPKHHTPHTRTPH